MKALLLLLTLTLAAPMSANADARPILLARSNADASFTPEAAQARLGDTVEVSVALREGRRTRSLPAGSRVRWLRVVPRLLHSEHAPPNTGDPTFSNSVLTGPQHGRWLGYDTLEYSMSPLVSGPLVHVGEATLEIVGVPPAPRSGIPTAPTRTGAAARGAGSLWLAAEVTLPTGEVLRTPDGTDLDRFGLSADVLRVSFRTGDDFLGWMSTYFDVPYVFGSTARQSNRYVGIDCADVLVGALRSDTGREHRYTSVRGIGALADEVSDVYFLDRAGRVNDAEGRPARLAWGSDIRPGDLLAIDYAGDPNNMLPRAWDHIGTLVSDAEGEGAGFLDGADILRHMGRRGLTDQPLTAQGQIRLRIWRWRASTRRRNGSP